jgi:hypothetical protein
MHRELSLQSAKTQKLIDGYAELHFVLLWGKRKFAAANFPRLTVNDYNF